MGFADGIAWEDDYNWLVTKENNMNQIKRFSWDGIDEKYKWVAQDYNGDIYVYTDKPTVDLETELWNNTNSEVPYIDCQFIRRFDSDNYIHNWQELCFPREETASTPKTNQQAIMIYDPSDRTEKPYPSHAEQYRQYHGSVAWLYNPWTGVMRDARDIGSDVLGHLIGNV